MGLNRVQTLCQISACAAGHPLSSAHTALKTRPHAMIKPALHSLPLDPSFLERVEHFLRYFFAPDIGVPFLVVMVREAIEAAVTHISHHSNTNHGLITAYS